MSTQLERLIGYDAAAKLAKEYGGSRIYVAKSESPKAKRIKDLIGSEAWTALKKEAGGTYLRVPCLRKKGPKMSKEAIATRNRQIVEQAWRSKHILSQAFRLSEAQIYLILRSSKPKEVA